jgi:hypothetical protein
MTKRQTDFLTIGDIRDLFKKYLNITIGRASVYHYIRKYDFPDNTGWGRPRQWNKKSVLAWFKNQTK